ncbi:hypothetical protein PQX77_021347 [Marasmius sp. AFHP31]|nr:hypothetical protein PQX77_021347 [Marasmius sp. AFHP31]
MWADWTDAEQAREKRRSRAREGLVDVLPSDCTFKRGQKNNQTHLYPQHLQNKPLDLVLSGPVQLYSKAQWENLVANVNKTDHKFKVSLAFEFETHVLAFVALDNLVQPTWFPSLTDLESAKPTPPDVFNDFSGFVSRFAEWVEEVYLSKLHASGGKLKKRTKLAISVFKACDVAHGAGVYTSNDAFWLAGESPFLLDHEVFMNPSRQKNEIWALIRRCIRGTLLAPSMQDREDYSCYLAVYGKDSVRCLEHEKNLVNDFKSALEKHSDRDEFWSRSNPATSLHEFFEPTNIKPVFEHTGFRDSIGATIFGQDMWARLGGSYSNGLKDPLSAMFEKYRLLDSPTYLSTYETLFVDIKARPSWRFCTTLLYRSDFQIWTLVPSFPANCMDSLTANVFVFPFLFSVLI